MAKILKLLKEKYILVFNNCIVTIMIHKAFFSFSFQNKIIFYNKYFL